ncbi:MAG: hypothetical protein M1825_005474 [Sarcosagium campestre]|nr:MAG: hypothetical protein M1825_005474 [Sarcosagium campestre]
MADIFSLPVEIRQMIFGELLVVGKVFPYGYFKEELAVAEGPGASLDTDAPAAGLPAAAGGEAGGEDDEEEAENDEAAGGQEWGESHVLAEARDFTRPELALLSTCRQIRWEAEMMLYRSNTWVLPAWPLLKRFMATFQLSDIPLSPRLPFPSPPSPRRSGQSSAAAAAAAATDAATTEATAAVTTTMTRQTIRPLIRRIEVAFDRRDISRRAWLQALEPQLSSWWRRSTTTARARPEPAPAAGAEDADADADETRNPIAHQNLHRMGRVMHAALRTALHRAWAHKARALSAFALYELVLDLDRCICPSGCCDDSSFVVRTLVRCGMSTPAALQIYSPAEEPDDAVRLWLEEKETLDRP